MIRLIAVVLAGIGLAVFSAIFGLSKNENFRNPESSGAAAVLAGAETADLSGTDSFGPRLTVLPGGEPGAVATIRINSATFRPVELYITDMQGRRVRTLLRRHLPAGHYQISWFGETELSAPLVPGLYIIILDSEKERQMAKVVL